MGLIVQTRINTMISTKEIFAFDIQTIMTFNE